MYWGLDTLIFTHYILSIMKRRIAVFDFDGTLTTRDTLLEFIKYACGDLSFYVGFLLYSPILILMKLQLYPNWKAKQLIFTHFFKGWDYSRFLSVCESFAIQCGKIGNKETEAILKRHAQQGDTVYVISASIDDWVKPCCTQIANIIVLGTKIEIDADGIVTGRFLTKNCYGQEKVNRLLEVEPHRNEYELFVYGDSRGDKEMIEFADYGKYIK